jgi:hypothetical protein
VPEKKVTTPPSNTKLLSFQAQLVKLIFQRPGQLIFLEEFVWICGVIMIQIIYEGFFSSIYFAIFVWNQYLLYYFFEVISYSVEICSYLGI